MTSVFDKIFGGSEQTQQSSSTPQNMNPFTTSLGPEVNSLAASLSNGIPQYTGPTSAPASDNENSLLGNLMTQNGQGGGAAGTNNYLSGVLNGNYLPTMGPNGEVTGNPFLSGAITAAQRTTMDNLTQTLGRTLPGYFTANGHMISPNNNGQGGSSAFDTAAAVATQGAANAMGDIASTMGSNAYGQERTNQQQAAQLSQSEVTNTINTLQAESLPRMIQQLGIQNGMSLYQTNVSGLLQLLQTLGGIAQPVVANAGQSTGSGSSTPGALAGITNFFKGGAGSAANGIMG